MGQAFRLAGPPERHVVEHLVPGDQRLVPGDPKYVVGGRHSAGPMAVSPTIHRITVHDYHVLQRIGIFSQDDRIELIEGECRVRPYRRVAAPSRGGGEPP